MIHDGLLTCGKCRRWMPLALFSRHASRSSGLQSYCKYCAYAATLLRSDEYKEFWTARLENLHNVSLVVGGEFHHRDPDSRSFGIATFMVTHAPTAKNRHLFDAEVGKCDYYDSPAEHGFAHRRLRLRKLDKLYATEMAKLGSMINLD